MCIYSNIATGLMFFMNYRYAASTVRRCYLSADEQRLGFEFYNMLGQWGRRVEAPLGNARLEDVQV